MSSRRNLSVLSLGRWRKEEEEEERRRRGELEWGDDRRAPEVRQRVGDVQMSAEMNAACGCVCETAGDVCEERGQCETTLRALLVCVCVCL